MAVGPVTIQSSDTTLYESPPVTTVLSNGNILFVWSNDAGADQTTMMLQGRIYNPSTNSWLGNQFQVGNVAVSGNNGFELDNLTVTQLTGGNVVVGWVRNNGNAGGMEPVYTVLTESGGVVMATAEIEGNDTEVQETTFESPPLITALDDGRWVAVWINDGLSDNTLTMTL